jgi:pyrroline-5-carboxylate reductase
MTLQGPLLLVGGGKMGAALAHGWLGAGRDPGDLHIVEPDAGNRGSFEGLDLGSLAAGIGDLPPDLRPAAIVLAVKPQVMDEVCPAYRALVGPGTLVLSIAAGKRIAAFEGYFGPGAAIVRAMPNTTAAVGGSASVLCANGSVDAAQRELARALIGAVGEVFWVEDEELMHAATALSGSGPAYVFHLVEAMAAAGVKLGLPEELATRLARATISGSGDLVRRSDEPAGSLRRNVTSPGGTTQAALEVLMAEDGLVSLIERAMAAAARRSRELA